MNKYIFLFSCFLLSRLILAESFMFGADDDANLIISEFEKNKVDVDKLSIGGNFIARFNYFNFEKTDNALFENSINSPNQLYLYADAKLRNDTRFFVKANVIYDPTLESNKYIGDLDELKILFNAYQKVFFTLGKQKIKHGASNFWNPTDFLNNTNRDILYTDDRRGGVNLLKTHVPLPNIMNSNLYFIQKFDNVNKIENISQMLRYELPISSSELAVSVIAKKHSKTFYGMDYSIGIWNFDLYSEAATNNTETKITFGASYEAQYNHNDVLILNAEYYFNDNKIIPFVYNPYNMSKHYLAFMLYLPQPYSLMNWDFLLMSITNIQDASTIVRFNVTSRIIQDVYIDVFFNTNIGQSPFDEFKYGGQVFSAGLELKVNF